MKNTFYLFSILMFAVVQAMAQVTSVDGTFSSSSIFQNTTLRTGTNNRVTILSTNGFTGINTTSPTTNLDINGSLRIRTITSGSTLTQMLVTDASGNINSRAIFPFTTSANYLGVGQNSMVSNTTGVWNAAFGNSTLAMNTSGQGNTALGYEASLSNTTGSYNVGVGFESLFNSATGSRNTAVGYRAGFGNTGGAITAIGYNALYSNNYGYGMNTAVGYESMYYTNTGFWNTAVGNSSLYYNTTGSDNVAIGETALFNNTTGNANTACGFQALSMATSFRNTALGAASLSYTTTGGENTAVGYSALSNNYTGLGNSAFGSGSGPNSDNLLSTLALGWYTLTTADYEARVGNHVMTSIGGQVSWSTLSDERFKKNIQEDVTGLAFITKLRPVSYLLDIEAQRKFLGIPDSIQSKLMGGKRPQERQTGFIAQEVEKLVKEGGYIFNGVDAPQNEKSHYSLRYSEFVVPLVKAVQELSVMVESQQKEIQDLKAQLVGNKSSDETISVAAKLGESNPNPFSMSTTIAITLPDNTTQADIMIYNLEGKQLKRVNVTDRGNVKLTVTSNDLAAGMYFYSLVVDGKIIDTKRMILTR